MPGRFDVIVLGLSPTGLYAVREAGRAGLSVLGVGEPHAIGRHSRYLTDRIEAPTPEQRITALMNKLTPNEEKPHLIVTSDQDLAAVFSHADALCDLVQMPNSYRNGLASKLMDKEQLYTICDALGVVYPKVWTASLDDAASLKNDISYPCMIKPARIHEVKHLMNGQKGWIVKDPNEYRSTIDTIPSAANILLIQEIIPGPESEIMLWAGHTDKFGQVRRRFTARKLRQFPPGFGSASLVQSETCTETAEIAERLLLQMEYDGIAAVEFKRHPASGELNLIEVNPRPSLWFSISSSAGANLVESLVQSPPDQRSTTVRAQLDGVRWRYALKDVASRIFYASHPNFILSKPDIGRAGKANRKTNAVFAIDDFRPAISEISSYLAKAYARFRLKDQRS